MKVKINNTLLELTQGDITDQTTDAIVNAANAALQLGGGARRSHQKKGRTKNSGRVQQDRRHPCGRSSNNNWRKPSG